MAASDSRVPAATESSEQPPAWMRGLWVGLTVGLFEGLIVARWAVVESDTGPAHLLVGAGWLLATVLVHAAAFGGLAVLAGRVVRSGLAVRLATVVFVASVFLARGALSDRPVIVGTLFVLLPLLAMVLALLPIDARRRVGRWSVDGPVVLCSVAGCLASTYGLFGRLPDYHFTMAQQGVAFAEAGLGAVVLGVSIAHAPRGAAVVVVVGGLVLGAMGVGRGLVGAGQGAERPPNVVWVLVDTLRRDHVPPFGDRTRATAIERLSAEGVRFDDAMTSVPKTPASVASYLTGLFPHQHGVRTLHDALPADRVTLPEAAKARGYATHAMINNPWLSEGRGFAQGFDRFTDFYEISQPYGPLKYVSWVVMLDQLLPRKLRAFEGQSSAAQLTDLALSRLRARDERPLFLYVHYFEPHGPYDPPAALAEAYGVSAEEQAHSEVNHAGHALGRGQMIFANPLPEAENVLARRLYQAEVHDTLDEVGRLIEGLDAMGLRDDTVVVFSADHGHALGEHDYWYHHGSFLYEPSLQVPLVVRYPPKVPAGAVVSTPFPTAAMAGLVAELAGIPFEATDLGPLDALIAGKGPGQVVLESDTKIFVENTRRPLEGLAGKLRGLRDERYKLIVTPGPDRVALELYDLQLDPTESHDLADTLEHEDRALAMYEDLLGQLPLEEVAQLERLRTGQATEADLGGGGAVAPIDANDLEMLRALGYVE